MTLMERIKELDRLYVKARETNAQEDWIAYILAKREVDALLNGKAA